MAVNESMSNPSEWIQFYQPNSPEIPTPPPTSSATSAGNHLIRPDLGRVAKPIRRRSRASRRTPTTLFNTDTTNFRAMVQQYTGGAIPPYATRAQLTDRGVATFGFDGMGTQQMGGTTAATLAELAQVNGFHVQYPNQQQQQQNSFMMGQSVDGGSAGSFSYNAPPGPSSGTNDYQDYGGYMR